MTQAAFTGDSPSGLTMVEQEIVRACEAARRDRSSVELIVVSKTFQADTIEPVLAAGQRVFGEN
ncbi:MAG: YggS family pyridoxal phosphate-dependent enzyme, partial [Sphingobacteriales bacterium]